MIEILSPGMLTTVQDLGREGFGPIGVSASGAADMLALRLGNRLLGNTDCSAALEMTILGGKFRFPQGATIAITGSDFGASVAMWRTLVIAPGETVAFGHTKTGARCYLCIAGGIDAPLWLGSASAHLHSGFGGGPIKKGDVLEVGPAHDVRAAHVNLQHDRTVLRVTPGLQGQGLTGTYRVTEEANRLGIRLEGESVTPLVASIISEGAQIGRAHV